MVGASGLQFCQTQILGLGLGVDLFLLLDIEPINKNKENKLGLNWAKLSSTRIGL